MKVCTIVGNRPQFVKASVVSRELKVQGIEAVLIHTGQHYDTDMSEVFSKTWAFLRPNTISPFNIVA